MKLKTCFVFGIGGIAFLCMSAVTIAQQVPWSAIEYEAAAYAKIWAGKYLREDYQENTGPELPVSAYAYVNRDGDPAFYSGSSSFITASLINISTDVFS